MEVNADAHRLAHLSLLFIGHGITSGWALNP